MKCTTIEATFKYEFPLIVVTFASKTGSSILTTPGLSSLNSGIKYLKICVSNRNNCIFSDGRSHLTLKLPSMHTDLWMQPQAIDPCPTGTWSSSGTEIPLAMIRCPENFGALCRTVAGSDWSISQELPLDQTGGEFHLVSFPYSR